jgi:membrane fusion protein (multidrug efflux system)
MTACGKGPQAPAGGPAPGGPGAGGPPPAMPVTAITVQPQAVPLLIESVGQAEGSREIEVRARVTGIVERRMFEEGQRVAAGAPLYRIERAPFEIALAQSRAVLTQEQARVEQARREAQRLKPLAEKEAISRREYDDAASALRTAEAALAIAQARVREAELNLSYTSVVAPIAGVTGRSVRSVGALVSPGAEGLLTTIAQTDPIWVRFAFSESQFAQLKAGNSPEVSVSTPEGKPLAAKGRLNFAATSVDARLGTIALRAEFANPRLAILPGQFVQARVKVGERQAFLVPLQAVMQNDQGKFVWTVGAEGKATPTPVKVGEWLGKDWVVEDGLKGGDRVIVDNLIKIRPGAPVQARAPGEAAPGAPGAAGPAGAATPAGKDSDAKGPDAKAPAGKP